MLLSVFTETYDVKDQITFYKANGLHIKHIERSADGTRKVFTHEGLFSVVFGRCRIENMIHRVSDNFERFELCEEGAIYSIKGE